MFSAVYSLCIENTGEPAALPYIILWNYSFTSSSAIWMALVAAPLRT